MGSIGLTPIQSSLYQTFPAVTTAGIVGSLIFPTAQLRPDTYTIDASVTGTPPVACTFRVEGSSDNVVWYGLDVTAPGTNSATASFMEHITNKPVLYLRINVVTYTPGDSTTSVVFHYTGAP